MLFPGYLINFLFIFPYTLTPRRIGFEWEKYVRNPSENIYQQRSKGTRTSTAEVLDKYNLSERQLKAIRYLQMHRLISNSIYQLAFEASKRTASRDLEEMVSEGIVEKVGTTGKGVHYSLRKGAVKGPKGPGELILL
jgi:predicted HTH transcriptional regulator